MRAQINLVCKRLPQGYSSPFKITTARNFSRQTNKQLQLHCKQFDICNWFPDGFKKPNTIFLFKCFLRDHRHEVFIQRYTKWLVPSEMANLIFLESHVSRGEARCWEEISSCKQFKMFEIQMAPRAARETFYYKVLSILTSWISTIYSSLFARLFPI